MYHHGVLPCCRTRCWEASVTHLCPPTQDSKCSRCTSIDEHLWLQLQEFLNSPGFFAWKSVLRCSVDGRSLRRSDSCLLKGEFFWLSAGNPRNEPWRTSCSMGAWRRGMAWGPPGSGRSIGDAVPSGGEAVPGGRAGMTEGWSGGGGEQWSIQFWTLWALRESDPLNYKHKLCSHLSSYPAVCHLARCCCPAGWRRSWHGRSPHVQMRCDWHQRTPSRRTPSPCAASSPNRPQRHSPLHGSVALPSAATNKKNILEL